MSSLWRIVTNPNKNTLIIKLKTMNTNKDQVPQCDKTAVMRWVSVKETLPLNDDEVLIFIGGDIVQAYLKDGKWKGSCMVTDNMNDGFVNDRVICVQGSHFDFVTHWMPLPTPPIA